MVFHSIFKSIIHLKFIFVEIQVLFPLFIRLFCTRMSSCCNTIVGHTIQNPMMILAFQPPELDEFLLSISHPVCRILLNSLNGLRHCKIMYIQVSNLYRFPPPWRTLFISYRAGLLMINAPSLFVCLRQSLFLLHF